MDFFYSLFVGIVMAAPLGPVAFFCIQKILLKQTQSAWFAASGAIAADAVLAWGALTGMRFLHQLMTDYAVLLHVGGSLVVLGMGCFLLLTRPRTHAKDLNSFKKTATFSVAFFITLLNPLALVAFVAAFSMFPFEHLHTPGRPLLLTLGAASGALLWWSFLIFLSSLGKIALNSQKIALIHKGTGAILLLLGVSVLCYIFG